MAGVASCAGDDERRPTSQSPRTIRRGRVSMRPEAADRLPEGRRTEDERLLASPATERPAFLETDTWRALRILSEFVEGFDALAEVGPAVTVFGSAPDAEADPAYVLSRTIGGELAKAGFAVITGGGPGVMEAANRGATRPAGCRSAATSSCRWSRTSTRTSTSASSSTTSSPARRCSSSTRTRS